MTPQPLLDAADHRWDGRQAEVRRLRVREATLRADVAIQADRAHQRRAGRYEADRLLDLESKLADVRADLRRLDPQPPAAPEPATPAMFDSAGEVTTAARVPESDRRPFPKTLPAANEEPVEDNRPRPLVQFTTRDANGGVRHGLMLGAPGESVPDAVADLRIKYGDRLVDASPYQAGCGIRT